MYKRSLLKLSGAVACGIIVFKKLNDFNSKPILASSNNTAKNYYSTSSEYPELNYNRNIMSKILTEHLYAKLRDRRTKNGFKIEDAIQTGVDNIGKYTSPGIVAGDEESYKVFGELFDSIIKEKHHGYEKHDEHTTDLDTNNLKINEPFDEKYVLSLRITAIRNLRGFTLPTFCSRGERREIEMLIVKILYEGNDKKPFKYSGAYLPIGLIDDLQQENLKKV